jgi:hypothetical protein
VITHEADAFRRNRSAYRIAEPLVAFYHAVMRPAWGDLERPGRAGAVWRRAQSTFRSKVVGPHFEQVCREWARRHATPETHGGHVTRVADGTVNDLAAKTSHEVDVAVRGETDGAREALLAIGEAKWNDVMGMGHLERLQHIRALLTARGTATDTKVERVDDGARWWSSAACERFVPQVGARLSDLAIEPAARSGRSPAAGTVDEVGEGVTGTAVGDEVFGLSHGPSRKRAALRATSTQPRVYWAPWKPPRA